MLVLNYSLVMSRGPFCCFGPKQQNKHGRVTRLIKLAQHTNVRELETVDMPVYIRSKSVTFYRHLLL